MTRFSTHIPGSVRKSRRWWDARGQGMPRILGGSRSGVFRTLLVCAVLQALVALGMAFLLKHILGSMRADAFDSWAFVGLACSGLAILACRAFEANRAEYLGQSYVLAVRTRMLKRIVMQSGQAQPATWGITMARMISDLNSLRNWVAVGLARGATALISLGGIVVTLALIEPLASLITLAGAAFCFLITLFTAGYFRQAVFDVRRWRGRLATRVGEQVMARRTVRQFDQLTNEAGRIRKLSKRLRRSSARRMTIAHSLRTLPQAIMPLTLGLTLLAVASPVEEFGVIVLLQGMAANTLREAVRSWDYKISFEIAQNRLAKVFQASPTRQAKSPVTLASSAQALSLDNVQLLGNEYTISGHLAAGSIVRIPTAVKVDSKTLFNALCRLQPLRHGTIKLGDVPLENVSLASLARSVQIVSTNVPLIRGSIEQNLNYGRSAEDLEISQLYQLGELNEELAALAVTESGSNLPDPLRSRIVLLRAVRTKPALLLVDDECLLADPTGLRTLKRTLLELGCTTIIATDNEIDWVETDWFPDFKVQTAPMPKEKNIVSIHPGASS